MDKVNQLPQKERVTIKVTVVKVNEPQTVPGGKAKQDVVVVDSTAKATVTLWESNIGLLKLKKSSIGLEYDPTKGNNSIDTID